MSCTTAVTCTALGTGRKITLFCFRVLKPFWDAKFSLVFVVVVVFSFKITNIDISSTQ